MNDKNSNKYDPNASAELDFDLARNEMIPLDQERRKRQEMDRTQRLQNLVAAGKQIAMMEEENPLPGSELERLKIIYPEMPDKKMANVFREIRTKLIQKSNHENFVVMVSPIVGFKDDDMITVNLAASFSLDTTKTAMLVDCHLHTPRLDKLFNLSNATGLTDFLENEDIPLEDVISPTGVERLRLIPAGERRESTSEYFTSVKMQILIDAVKRRYPDRYIFLDAPAIGESADARIIYELCDYIILVIPYGKVTESKLTKILDSLNRNKIIGVIFQG